MNAHEAAEAEQSIDAALSRWDFAGAEEAARRYLQSAPDHLDNGRPSGPAESPRFRALWLAAQVALAAGRLEEARERVRPLAAQIAEVPLALACRILLLAAEAHARLGDATAARAALADLESDGRLAKAWPMQPLLRLRHVRIRLWLGDVRHLAAEIAALNDDLADDAANGALLLCEAGRAWDAAGDLAEAERCWTRAADRAARLGRHPVRADALIQLGRLAHLRGHLQPALDRYEEARASLPPQSPQVPEVGFREALVWLDLNREDRARRRFEEARLEGPPVECRGLEATVAALLGDATAGAGGDEVQAYRAAALGDRRTARLLYERACAREKAPIRRGRFAVALAQLALADRDGHGVKRWLDEAERLGRLHDLPEVLWRSLEARGRAAAELEGDDARARACFEEAVLVTEGQVRRLRQGADAAVYHLHRASLLRLLLAGACRRGDTAAAFRCQELERGRLLCELYRAAGRRAGRPTPADSAALADVDRRLETCERLLGLDGLDAEKVWELNQACDRLRLERDRLLEEYLSDRSRRGDAALPHVPELAELEQSLPPGAVFVAPAVVGDELYLLTARRGRSEVRRAAGSALRLRDQLRGLREALGRALRSYAAGAFGPAGRAELDARLDELGEGVLGSALDDILAPGERLVWAPDGDLHGLPVAALRRGGRYLVERREVVYAFSGALWAHQARRPPRSRRRWGPSVVVTEEAAVLPEAGREGKCVRAALFRARPLHGGRATRQAVRALLPRARVVHFACHAHFDADHPLDAHLRLPSGETWRALEWLDEPAADLPLVVFSACRSAEVGRLVGREVYGLTAGVLAAGARAVVAGLWSVPDREAADFMARFYRRRLTTDLATALAEAQRESIHDPGASPLFWAVFALFGDPQALPAPGPIGRWWGRLCAARHARRFPVPPHPTLPHPRGEGREGGATEDRP